MNDSEQLERNRRSIAEAKEGGFSKEECLEIVDYIVRRSAVAAKLPEAIPALLARWDQIIEEVYGS